jgi:outer membrane biosynthesis protein TonB
MRRAIVAGIVLAAMMGLSGCKKKKPPIPPPQAQAPTITPETQPAPQPPAPAAEPNRPQPEAAPPPAEPTTTTTKPKVKKPRPSTAAAKKTPPPASQPEKPSRTVVEQGGTQPAGAQLSASIPPDEAIHQKFTTAQLLQSADSNLKAISRPLNADEQATVQHIRSLMQQSRDATKDGDSDRAYNLAWKAHLLVDELIKR